MSPTETPALLRIEQVLSELTRLVSSAYHPPAAVTEGLSQEKQILNGASVTSAGMARIETASAWVRARAARDSALGADLFSDPAWAMLLDLYINGGAQNGLAVTSLSSTANVPLTTGTRWIALLEKAGLVRRTADAFDRRRTLVTLTEDGVHKIDKALDRTR